MSYLFRNYVKTLSGRLQMELATILVEHNFDYAQSSRNVALHKGGDLMTDPEEIVAAVRETGLIGTDYPPDLIVLGNDNIVFPVIGSDDKPQVLHSPFFIPGESRLTHRTVNGIAPGLRWRS
jgi:hypothetical protein